jgi:UDP-glucose 4-epimerase
MEICFAPDRPADVPRLWVDSTKFKNLTGFTNQMNFQKGLEETVNYYIDLAKGNNLMEEIQLENWKS